MRISLLVAVAENGVIGRDGRLPWHLPADLKRFKKLTLGHVVIMGRKTHESIVERLGRPLPKRRSIVLSRDPCYSGGGQTQHRSGGGQTQHRCPPGVEVASSLEQALELASAEPTAFVIGGAGLFAEALPLADCLYLTRVHAEVEGDVFFPEIDAESWRLVSEERHEIDERHRHAFSFLVYDRL